MWPNQAVKLSYIPNVAVNDEEEVSRTITTWIKRIMQIIKTIETGLIKDDEEKWRNREI